MRMEIKLFERFEFWAYNGAMLETVVRIYDTYLADLPVDMRPFVRSLAVTRLAAHYEKSHELDKTEPAWAENTAFQQEELKNPDKDEVFNRAVFLATLPQSGNEDAQWYHRWLRGNGLGILQDKAMKNRLISFLDSENGKPLASALDKLLSTSVTGFTMESLSDVPEGYSLFATFLVCFNFWTPDMTGERERLFGKAMGRLMEDEECNRVMDLFGEIEDTKPLYKEFNTLRNWFLY